MSSEQLKLKVLEVIQETGDAHSLVFESPDGADLQAGPVPDAAAAVRRRDGRALLLAVVSAPDVDDHLKVTIKRVVDGRGSNYVCDTIKAGDEVDVLAPSGTFTPKDLDADLLLLAGGSGITPVMSIIKSSLATGQRPDAAGLRQPGREVGHLPRRPARAGRRAPGPAAGAALAGERAGAAVAAAAAGDGAPVGARERVHLRAGAVHGLRRRCPEGPRLLARPDPHRAVHRRWRATRGPRCRRPPPSRASRPST